MRITITCPACNKKSQIDSSLRGKRLRCPYPDCKKPFRLSETGEAISLDSPAVVEAPKVVDWQAAQGTGAPGSWDMPAVADWQAAPPPQRGADGEGYEAPAEQAWDEGQPAAYGTADEAVEYTGEPEEYEAGEVVDYYAPVKKKKHSYYMLVLILVGIVGLAAGALAWVKINEAAQNKAFTEALKEYDAGHFSTAEPKFKQLGEKFPDSPNAARYRFMEKLAGVRASAGESGMDVDKAEEALRKFHSEYRGKPMYKEYIEDIWLGTEGFVNAGFAAVEKSAQRTHLDKLRGAFDQILKDVGPGIKDQKIADAAYANLEKRYLTVNAVVTQAEARKLLIAYLDERLAEKHPSAVEKGQLRFEADTAPHRYPKLAADAQIKAKLDQLKAAEPGLITYTRHNTPLAKPPAGTGDGTTLAVCPLVQGKPTAASTNDPVVLSLSKGVLYAHTLSTGELLWGMRVGVDTQTLPARVHYPPRPEIALVLATDTATDTATVTAVNIRTGEALWVYPLGATCPAGPILAGRIAYFPTVERVKDEKGAIEERGKVHEVEAVDGKLLGVFDVGQPLTVPGSFDPVARRLFVPADRKRIYVLDVDGKKCAGVYYTKHTVGGLRAAPIVTPTTLVVAEANSVLSMVIKSFTLSESGDKETETADKYRIRGWAWSRPYFDGDTLGYLTDRGSLALFGLKRGTRDEKPVIMLGPAPDRAGGNLYGLPVGEQRGLEASSQPPIGQAQIAHVDLNEWWLLVGGKLYRYWFDLYRQQLVRGPGEPLYLGSPLQASQARGQYLVLGTQALDRNQLTALDRRSGAIAWQRQLGLITAQEPVLLGNHLIAIDRTGGLFHMEAGKVPATAKDKPGRIAGPSAGDWLANGLPVSDPNSPPRLIASPDGQFALAALYAPAPVDKLTLRRYEPGKGIVSERTYRFDSPPLANSTPALSNQSLIIPCRDGNLRELPLAGTTELPVTLAWRNRDAAPDAACQCVYLSDTQLVASDGLRSLGRWERGDDAERRWRKTGNVEFSKRFATPLVVVVGPQNEKLLCFGDSDGEVTLYSMARGENVRSWRFENQQITKGPFLRGNHLGVVLDGNELVWLDPTKEAPLFKKTFGELGIVGEPQLIGSHVLVAETGGLYTWLDLNGKEQGKNQLKSLIVPATAAVPFGPNQAFAPLSDGTILILTPPGAPTAKAD